MACGDERLLGPSDDGFHVDSDDPWQTEGSWWCFFARERRLEGWIYHLTRPNLGLASGGVWVWDDSASLFTEVPYFRDVRLQPLGAGPRDLNDITWPDGVHLRTLRALASYRLTYDDGSRLSLDLTYDAVTAPFATTAGTPARVVRFEQPCRVTGSLVLDGEEIAIDCLAMRDHSWGIRRDEAARTGRPADPARRAGRPIVYVWGHAPGDAGFLVMAGQGYLLLDGERRDLATVTQEVRRDPATGALRRLFVRGVDTEGRPLEATGEVLGAILRPSGSGSLVWVTFLEWTINGRQGLGDAQDAWSIDEWSAYRAWLRR